VHYQVGYSLHPWLHAQNRFKSTYGDRGKSAIAFAFNDDFARVLQNQIRYYNDNPSADNIGRVRSQIADVKDVMVQNIGTKSCRDHPSVLFASF
jgi:hypothetical protein